MIRDIPIIYLIIGIGIPIVYPYDYDMIRGLVYWHILVGYWDERSYGWILPQLSTFLRFSSRGMGCWDLIQGTPKIIDPWLSPVEFCSFP
jgi:hypothetical protein